MDYFAIPGRPATGSRLETEEGFFEFDGKRWNRFPHQCETQECADGPVPKEAEPVRPARRITPGGLADYMTDANHDFAEDMAKAFSHNVHVGIDTGFMELPETQAVHYLLDGGDGLHKWLRHFLSKQVDYGDHANELGAKGQYADMYRKWPKIRKVLWEDGELVGEQVDEVVLDLIGHCFLTLMFLAKEKGEFK